MNTATVQKQLTGSFRNANGATVGLLSADELVVTSNEGTTIGIKADGIEYTADQTADLMAQLVSLKVLKDIGMEPQ